MYYLDRCHTIAYRLTYLRRSNIRKVRHAYVVHTWAYVAHTPRYVAHTPRCYVFLCVHLKICSRWRTWQVRYAVHTSNIRRTYESNVADTPLIRSSYSWYATRTSRVTCHVTVAYVQRTFRICYVCETYVWRILDSLFVSTAYKRHACGVSHVSMAYVLCTFRCCGVCVTYTEY